MPLKFGRRPPKNAPRLQFKQFWTGSVPPTPPSVDYLKTLTGWEMLGNDVFGCCVAVMAANNRRLVTATLGTQYYPTQDEVFALYKTQNPNFVPDPQKPVEDNGMDIQTMLEWWMANEWGGCKLVAFAAVNPTDLNELKAAIAIFGSVLPGLNVTQANERQFAAGKPWDYAKGQLIVGGHAVVAGGYSGTAASDIDFITWAQETSFTDNDVAHNWQECWVAIMPEHLGTKEFEAGIDVNALASAYQTLTGKVLPITNPPPPPPVGPTYTPWGISSQTDTQIVMTRTLQSGHR